MRKKVLEKFTAQKFKNCYFRCVILINLVLIGKEVFKGYNYVTKFRFQQITYLNKSIFMTTSAPQPRLSSYYNDDDDYFNDDNYFFSYHRF